MTELFSWLTGFATFNIATVDTVEITIGLVTAFAMIGGLAFGLLKKARGRA